jgi:hypothetical protein
MIQTGVYGVFSSLNVLRNESFIIFIDIILGG